MSKSPPAKGVAVSIKLVHGFRDDNIHGDVYGGLTADGRLMLFHLDGPMNFGVAKGMGRPTVENVMGRLGVFDHRPAGHRAEALRAALDHIGPGEGS